MAPPYNISEMSAFNSTFDRPSQTHTDAHKHLRRTASWSIPGPNDDSSESSEDGYGSTSLLADNVGTMNLVSQSKSQACNFRGASCTQSLTNSSFIAGISQYV